MALLFHPAASCILDVVAGLGPVCRFARKDLGGFGLGDAVFGGDLRKLRLALAVDVVHQRFYVGGGVAFDKPR